jgi:hypothetical protein
MLLRYNFIDCKGKFILNYNLISSIRVNHVRKLVERIVIDTPMHAVWDVMADFGSAAPWAPGMVHSSLIGDKKTGVGTHRVLRHVWGFKIEEIVTEWVEGAGYSFKLVKAPYPMRDVCETWILRSDDKHTLLTITVSYAMRLGPIGFLLDALLVKFLVAREIRRGIFGLKHYVEKNFTKTPSNPQPASTAREMPLD